MTRATIPNHRKLGCSVALCAGLRPAARATTLLPGATALSRAALVIRIRLHGDLLIGRGIRLPRPPSSRWRAGGLGIVFRSHGERKIMARHGGWKQYRIIKALQKSAGLRGSLMLKGYFEHAPHLPAADSRSECYLQTCLESSLPSFETVKVSGHVCH